MGKKSLADQISELAKPRVADFDIEDTERDVFEHFEDDQFNDEDGDDSADEGKDEELEKQHYVHVPKSRLRDDGLKVNGVKYSGEAKSRKDLYEDESEEDEGEEEEEEENTESENSAISFESDSEEAIEEEDVEEEDEDENLEENDDLEDVTDDKYKRNKLKELLSNERKHIVNRLSESAQNDALKGYAVLNQQKYFDQFLDLRIKLQKSLIASNQLPIKKEIYEEFKDNKSSSMIKTIEDKLYDALDSIFELRSKIFLKENVIKSQVKLNNRKRKASDYLDQTNELDSILNRYRKNVLVKWSHKVQSSSGSTALNSNKFKIVNQNANIQVETNLQDMERMIKRTRINRRNIIPLGYVEDKKHETDETNFEDDSNPIIKNIDKSLQENQYIFDDEDFYRSLLNDLVDKKLSSSNNQLSSSMVIVNKSTLKSHKNYERKASKGRKLNYKIQEPIANFETPRNSKDKWSDHQIDEYFAGLLGQKVNMNEQSDAEESASEQNEQNEEEEEEEEIQNDGVRIFG
ncbi:hypothetical protein PACTADRAFT_50330 [Pachysolen tannophilus NRRL Y-2460]|uniref:Protein BFR2 n=1 Tax=Pachysolen tannophilus NRRL Y-2460 TaxID=669874 RepID=A0A1E4TV74_PACTA|nr:hypothetical protein PACTADRAFT_50330 [Pachysolen tannophilus NRRL Y-2460]